MSEVPGSTPESVAVTRDVDNRADRRLQRTLAWVGIVAGVVFTVAVIFFSGLALGRATTNHHGWQRGYQGSQMGPGGCPMMGGGMMGGPGSGPGMMRPGPQPPPSAAPPSASAPPQG